jgi:hypothetical protein
MSAPEFVNVYPYPEEVVVELGVDGPDGDLSVLSFQFEFCGENRVAPKADVADQYQPVVEEALESQGFAVQSVA